MINQPEKSIRNKQTFVGSLLARDVKEMETKGRLKFRSAFNRVLHGIKAKENKRRCSLTNAERN